MKKSRFNYKKTSLFFIILTLLYPLITIAADDIYEDDDTYQNAKILIPYVDELQVRNFFSADDNEDWVKFYVLSSQRLEIIVKNQSTNCDIKIEIYDSNGTDMLNSVNDGFEGEDESIQWSQFQQDDIYYARITNFNGEHGDDTSYTLKMWFQTAPEHGTLYGTVKDNNQNPLGEVKIKTDGPSATLSLTDTGSYTIQHDPGSFTLTAEADGYQKNETSFDIALTEFKQMDIVLTPLTSGDIPGDINQDSTVDLLDAILALQILTGKTDIPQAEYKKGDVDGEGIVGLEEVIYILKDISS